MVGSRKPKMEKYTINDFNRQFPDDAACLDWLREYLYPDGVFCEKCGRVTKHHRVVSRPSYSCDRCGHHVHPTAGTIFEKSTTPLRLWFHAIFLMAQTRCGISAKQIQRETGVTYKTAWRMFNRIRSLLSEDVGPLGGEVEIDEAYMGGRLRDRGLSKQEAARRRMENKTPVLGIVQRRGKVHATKIPGVSRDTILPVVQERVLPASMVYTDEHQTYGPLPSMGYGHRRIHHASKVYVVGDVHTNTIEGFWSLLKRGISGVYHSVSDKYLQHYLDEYSFRYNHRDDVQPMFQTFLRRVEKA
jgi:transposase